MWSLSDVGALSVAGVSEDENRVIRELVSAWTARYPKNRLRSLYYDTEQAFRDLGIALPPQLRNAETVLGWAAQAVRKPAMRSQFEGLRLPGSDNPFELSDVLAANSFGLEFSQAVVSAYTHGFALVTVARGGPGEPPVMIQGHDAESSAALWDRRGRRISAALTVAEVRDERPTRIIVYLPHAVLDCAYVPGSGWHGDRIPNPVGRALAVPVLSDPQLRRPLGRSRITNAVMTLTNMAVRTFVRMEGQAELFSGPQIALLGLDESAFSTGMSDSQKFRLAMDRVLALTKDSDGDIPKLQQLTQANMTPHSDMLRTVASAFSGETSIPVSSLGIIHDNPSSAEAIRAAEHDLLIDATYHNKHVHSVSARDIAVLAVMVRDGLSEPPVDAWRLSARFADPEFRSMSAQADAVQKLAADMDNISRWDVLLETAFDEGQVARIREQAASIPADQSVS